MFTAFMQHALNVLTLFIKKFKKLSNKKNGKNIFKLKNEKIEIIMKIKIKELFKKRVSNNSIFSLN